MRAGNLAAYGHADLPFERLVEVLNPARSLSRHPLFQVMLAFEAGAVGGAASLELPGLEAGAEPVTTAGAKFDLSLGLIEQRGADGAPAGIDGVLEYASDLFDAATVEALGRRLIRLLAAAVADPARALAHCRSWSRPSATHHPAALERHRPFRASPMRCDRAGHPAGAVCGAGFAHAGAAAVMFEDRVLSYAELDAHANRLAHHLQSLGVGPETMVGCWPSVRSRWWSPDGILKAGGAYLPLDPDYPRERLTDMVSDAGLGVVLLQGALAALLPLPEGSAASGLTVRRSARRALALRER